MPLFVRITHTHTRTAHTHTTHPHNMKRTIEIEDTLEDCTQSAIEDTKQALLEYLKENEPKALPCLNDDLDYSGQIHEIVDGSVPVYTREIETAWFLHGSSLESAYENAGVGENPRENDGMAAIYFYIMESVQDWYSNEAQAIFDAWKVEFDAKAEAEMEASK